MFVYEFMVGGIFWDYLICKFYFYVFEVNFDILFIKFYLLCSVEVLMFRMYVCVFYYSDGDYGFCKVIIYSVGDCMRYFVFVYGSRFIYILLGY